MSSFVVVFPGAAGDGDHAMGRLCRAPGLEMHACEITERDERVVDLDQRKRTERVLVEPGRAPALDDRDRGAGLRHAFHEPMRIVRLALERDEQRPRTSRATVGRHPDRARPCPAPHEHPTRRPHDILERKHGAIERNRRRH